jgi:hypothetical protein
MNLCGSDGNMMTRSSGMRGLRPAEAVAKDYSHLSRSQALDFKTEKILRQIFFDLLVQTIF